MYKPKPHADCDMHREKRLKNQATKAMTKNMARNLVYYAQLLKDHPLETKA